MNYSNYFKYQINKSDIDQQVNHYRDLLESKLNKSFTKEEIVEIKKVQEMENEKQNILPLLVLGLMLSFTCFIYITNVSSFEEILSNKALLILGAVGLVCITLGTINLSRFSKLKKAQMEFFNSEEYNKSQLNITAKEDEEETTLDEESIESKITIIEETSTQNVEETKDKEVTECEEIKKEDN